MIARGELPTFSIVSSGTTFTLGEAQFGGGAQIANCGDSTAIGIEVTLRGPDRCVSVTRIASLQAGETKGHISMPYGRVVNNPPKSPAAICEIKYSTLRGIELADLFEIEFT